MSTVPPGASPPPSTSTALAALPWEDRERRGLLQALLDTIGLFLSRPAEAWARTREGGDMASPLFFGMIVAWFSFVVHRLIARVITVPLLLPGAFGRRFGAMGAYGGGRLVVAAILAPIFIAIGLFIGAVILHLCCLIVGALSGSHSGFEGSFRVVAYSQVTSLAGIIPAVGWIIAFVWWIVLAVMGVQRLHRTTQGKATAAVLIPVVVCCGGLMLLGLVAGAAFLMRGAR